MGDDLSERRALRMANRVLYDARHRRRYARVTFTAEASPEETCEMRVEHGLSEDFAPRPFLEPPRRGALRGFFEGFCWVLGGALLAFGFLGRC